MAGSSRSWHRSWSGCCSSCSSGLDGTSTAKGYPRMNTSFFQELMGSIAERGRALVDRSATRPAGKGDRRTHQPETLESLCRALVSGRGEASGVALARQVLDLY